MDEHRESLIYLGDKLPTIYDAAIHIYDLSPTPGSQKRYDVSLMQNLNFHALPGTVAQFDHIYDLIY